MQKSHGKIQARVGKTSLRQRIREFYQHFNGEDWPACFQFLDPVLKKKSRVDLPRYAASLAQFKEYYGHVQVRFVEVHLFTQGQGTDSRDFAYVVILWKDKAGSYHLFRERWIKEKGRWYTRVVGLVFHEKNGKSNDKP